MENPAKTHRRHDNIAKKLRGRSIIVTLLTDFLATVVLRELDLPIWHMLFAGGGHFNLLIPNTPENEGMLKVLNQDLDHQMRLRLDDNLQLVFAQAYFSKEEIKINPGKCFSKLNLILEEQKFQQHRKYLDDHFFSEKEDLEKTKERRRAIEKREVEIGERFPKRQFLVEAVTKGPVFQADNDKVLEIASFDLHKYSYSLLVPEDTELIKTVSDHTGLVSAQVFSINNTDFLKIAPQIPSSKIGFGFRFLGKKTVPLIRDEKMQGRDRPQTFEEIVEGDNDQNKMLAALRLDVDDLGFIFSKGMADAKLGEIACLSREMQYFFSVHFDGLAEKHQLYVIYSGGDDAFVVGKWDNIIGFTAELQTDFESFYQKQPRCTFQRGHIHG